MGNGNIGNNTMPSKVASRKGKRQQDLINIIETQGMLPVRSIAAMLNVSEMTVRRDLEKLRNDGGAAGEQSGQYNLLEAIEHSNHQKEEIGKYAASLIKPNDVIIIDTGSTTARILPYLPENMNLTILSYNANVLIELRHKPGIQLLFCGGNYHLNTEMFESEEGIAFIRRIRANKAFLSAAGIHRELGITCANTYEVATKQAAISSSSQKILVSDSSKFGRLRSAYFCDLDEIDTIITDHSLQKYWRDELRQRNIELHEV